MEGVVLVEMCSGALHYTKSFSTAFDERHPKTDRLNLAALIFALQNFADSSIRPPGGDEELDVVAESQSSSSVGTGIVMFATPQERMVLAATPSNQLLVVLFTTPAFDAIEAKWLVRQLAHNYEKGESAEMRLLVALNQVPRRFRDAFSRTVDEKAEYELIVLGERIFGASSGGDEAVKPDPGVLFVFFQYSESLNASQPGPSSDNDDEAESGAYRDKGEGAELDDRDSECGLAIRAANPPLAQIGSGGGLNHSLHNMMAFTRSLLPLPSHVKEARRHDTKHRKSHKMSRHQARNAVMDYSEPHVLQRVVEVNHTDGKAAIMEPHRTGPAFGFVDVLIPFVELVTPVLASDTTMPTVDMPHQQKRSQQLEQIVWRNAPSSALEDSRGGATAVARDVVAWRQGRCLLFHPMTASSIGLENERRLRILISALFALLEPLLRAKAMVQA